jgi:hypothetical protein
MCAAFPRSDYYAPPSHCHRISRRWPSRIATDDNGSRVPRSWYELSDVGFLYTPIGCALHPRWNPLASTPVASRFGHKNGLFTPQKKREFSSISHHPERFAVCQPLWCASDEDSFRSHIGLRLAAIGSHPGSVLIRISLWASDTLFLIFPCLPDSPHQRWGPLSLASNRRALP